MNQVWLKSHLHQSAIGTTSELHITAVQCHLLPPGRQLHTLTDPSAEAEATWLSSELTYKPNQTLKTVEIELSLQPVCGSMWH